jgi:O-antigen ligase/tetratricopeptide (TPR) repeat protein
MANTHEPLPARWVRAAGEGLLVGIATLSAWPFASARPLFEYLLAVGVVLLCGCWLAHAALTRRFTFRGDLVSLSLAGLLLLTAVQLVPLPLGVVQVLSPTRAEWHESLLPGQLERLPGESDVARPSFLPLTVIPHATRTLAARLLGVFAVYAAARNWLADRDTLRRFAWAVTLNGVLLAVFGIGQFFSSKPGVMFWSEDTGGGVFGPFICRNHYPDYVAFGVGGAIYLLHPRKGERARSDGSVRGRLLGLLDIFDRPASLAAALALGVMLASIPFSQSRGGVLAVAVAGAGVAVLGGWGKGKGGPVVAAVGVAAAVAVGLVLWLGIGPIADRFRDDDRTLDDRVPLWSAAAGAANGTWATGTGGGTFAWVEPLGRTTQSATVVYEHAHNEYLEAVVEGGAVRLGLTLLLAVGVPVLLGRRVRRLRGRSAGAFVLGVWFAVVVLAVHSAVDFAVHLPSVAVMAAAAVGLAFGVRKDDESEAPPFAGSRWAVTVPALLTLAVLMAALDARSRWRADDLRNAADATDDPATRVELNARRTRVAPTDPTAWSDLAQAHLAAAARERTPAGYPDQTVQRHLIPALSALRTARGLCPLHPDVHFALGLHARRFERGEPPVVHFRRVSRLLPTAPDVWYARGVEELASGDRAAAEACWRRSLDLGPRWVKAILLASSALPPEALRDRVLGDDPAVLMLAASERPAGERRVFVEAAARSVDRTGMTAAQLTATAEACDELDRIPDAKRMWERAKADRPQSREVRDAAARWFERLELYSDAVPHLEWLAERSPTDAGLRDRLAAARHGAELRRKIGR